MMNHEFDWLLPLAPWEKPEVLSTALKSLAEQTICARALVVSVDGKLTDELRHLLISTPFNVELYEYSRWTGTGLTLARGIIKCKSDIILRVDADDFSLPERSFLQFNKMKCDPDISVFGGQLKEIIHKHSNIIKRIKHVPLEPAKIKERSIYRNPINHPTVALRRSHILAVGNYRNVLLFEDYDLWLRLIKNNYKIENDTRVLVKSVLDDKHHLRRHGLTYAWRELVFLCRSIKEKNLPPMSIFFFAPRLLARIMPRIISRSIYNSTRNTITSDN